jgi:formylglycine-generating enzyme required for sulfatase activity
MVKGHRIQLMRFSQAKTAAWDAIAQFGCETPAASAAPTHRLQAADHCRPRALPVGFLPLAEWLGLRRLTGTLFEWISSRRTHSHAASKASPVIVTAPVGQERRLPFVGFRGKGAMG